MSRNDTATSQASLNPIRRWTTWGRSRRVKLNANADCSVLCRVYRGVFRFEQGEVALLVLIKVEGLDLDLDFCSNRASALGRANQEVRKSIDRSCLLLPTSISARLTMGIEIAA